MKNNYKKTREYQIKRKNKLASIPSDKKCQCFVCGRWYIQVGSHVSQIHKMTAREYREKYNLEVKRGTTPEWYRELKGKQALENGSYKNLKAGKKHRFKKGQKNIGTYKRSQVTMERLKDLHKLTNRYKQKNLNNN